MERPMPTDSAHATLAEEVATLTGILEAITDGRCSFDREWRFTFVNDRAERHLGRSREALIGAVLWDVFPEARDGVAYEEYQRALRDGTPRRFEAVSVVSRTWLEIFCYPLPDGGLAVNFRDISERHQSRQAIDTANRDLRLRIAEIETLLDVMPVATAVALDRDSTRIRINRACGQLLRLQPNPDGIGSATAASFTVWRDGQIVGSRDLPLQVAAREGREVRELNLEIAFDDGAKLHVLEYAAPLFDEQGAPRGSVGVLVDLTERLTADQRFRLMADHAPVMIWVTAPDGACTFLSRPWYEFTGQTPDSALGFGWLEAVHPEDRTVAAARFARATERTEAFRMEYRLRRSDGTYRWALDSATPNIGIDGRFLGFIGTVIDITERKEAEDERERLLEGERRAHVEADRANRLKDEFLASLSHELRTPLNAVLGWAQLLRTRKPTPEFLEQGLETIERNSKLQTQLIDDLLDMSRILSGHVRLDVQQVNIAQAVEGAVEALRPAADAKSIRLTTVIDPHAGPVSGDPTRLQQIFWNLLSNAVKFTPRHGKVQIILERVNSHLEVTVSDTGVGMSPEFLPHVFERFRQADSSTTRRHGGLGLGLSIAKQLTELHGGSIRAKSPGPDLGATFIVALPVAIVRHDDTNGQRSHPRSASVEPTEPTTVSLEGVHVLVVEDDLDARRLVTLILEGCGATVETAGTAAAALQLVIQRRPDVIVSDIGLPEMDGYAFIHAVRSLGAEYRAIPALALTAFARSEDRRRALLAGFQLHLAKPAEPAELCTAVGSLAKKITSV